MESLGDFKQGSGLGSKGAMEKGPDGSWGGARTDSREKGFFAWTPAGAGETERLMHYTHMHYTHMMHYAHNHHTSGGYEHPPGSSLSLIHLTKYLLSTYLYHVLGVVLGTGDTVVNRKDTNS